MAATISLTIMALKNIINKKNYLPTYEVVSRYRDPQLQVGEHYLFYLRPIIWTNFIPTDSDLTS